MDILQLRCQSNGISNVEQRGLRFLANYSSRSYSLMAFERFAGRAGATDELREFCKAGNIGHEWQSG
jgi:hypothetical protein